MSPNSLSTFLYSVSLIKSQFVLTRNKLSIWKTLFSPWTLSFCCPLVLSCRNRLFPSPITLKQCLNLLQSLLTPEKLCFYLSKQLSMSSSRRNSLKASFQFHVYFFHGDFWIVKFLSVLNSRIIKICILTHLFTPRTAFTSHSSRPYTQATQYNTNKTLHIGTTINRLPIEHLLIHVQMSSTRLLPLSSRLYNRYSAVPANPEIKISYYLFGPTTTPYLGTPFTLLTIFLDLRTNPSFCRQKSSFLFKYIITFILIKIFQIQTKGSSQDTTAACYLFLQTYMRELSKLNLPLTINQTSPRFFILSYNFSRPIPEYFSFNIIHTLLSGAHHPHYSLPKISLLQKLLPSSPYTVSYFPALFLSHTSNPSITAAPFCISPNNIFTLINQGTLDIPINLNITIFYHLISHHKIISYFPNSKSQTTSTFFKYFPSALEIIYQPFLGSI